MEMIWTRTAFLGNGKRVAVTFGRAAGMSAAEWRVEVDKSEESSCVSTSLINCAGVDCGQCSYHHSASVLVQQRAGEAQERGRTTR